jgi:hypothetical protein
MTPFTGKLTTEDGRLVVQISGQIKEHGGDSDPAWSGSLQLPHVVVGKMTDGGPLFLDVSGGPRIGIVMETIHGPRGTLYPRVDFQSSGLPVPEPIRL